MSENKKLSLPYKSRPYRTDLADRLGIDLSKHEAGNLHKLPRTGRIKGTPLEAVLSDPGSEEFEEMAFSKEYENASWYSSNSDYIFPDALLVAKQSELSKPEGENIPPQLLPIARPLSFQEQLNIDRKYEGAWNPYRYTLKGELAIRSYMDKWGPSALVSSLTRPDGTPAQAEEVLALQVFANRPSELSEQAKKSRNTALQKLAGNGTLSAFSGLQTHAHG